MNSAAPKFSNDLYSRGFALYPSGMFRTPAGFKVKDLGSWSISLHELTRFHVAQCRHTQDFVALIGYAMDLEGEHDDQACIAEQLLESLRKSERVFFERLSAVAGRYVVAYASGGRLSVVGDACATRTVFYAADRPLVGSHFNLVAEMAGTGPSSQKLLRNRDKLRHSCYGYAAGATPDRNVFLLLANMVLRLPGMSPERFYPFGTLPHVAVEDAARKIDGYFAAQARLLTRRYTCHISLTAGLDSRVSLAAFAPFRSHVRTFSYLTQPAHDVDTNVAGAIANHCEMEHVVLDGDNIDRADLRAFTDVVARNNYHKHNLVAAYRYKSYFDDNSVHVRSNLFEIGRAFYRSQRSRREGLNAREMASLYFKYFSEGRDQDLVKEFDGYIANSRFKTALFNYDPYDVFYWEQRMSCWHSMVVLEADPSVETVLLFNARVCIEQSLAVPLEERVAGTVFKRIIQMRWPDLMNFPINPKKFDAQRRE